MRALAAVVVTACVMAPASALMTCAWADGPFDGRWAADPQACAGGKGTASVLLVNSMSLSLRWREAACVIGRSYRVGDAWNIGARCWADGATANVPIRLDVRGDRLSLDWGGAPAQELRRCP
jgi:hypothetical protein